MPIDDVEEVSVVGGTLRWRPVRRALDAGAFGVNAYAADAGQDIVEDHDERDDQGGGHEELYVVLRGRARFRLDGEEHDAPAGTMVFAKDPGVRRFARAEEDGTLILAVGADPAKAYEVSPWETWFLAEPLSRAGEHDKAIALMDAAEHEHAGNASFHYNFACFLARAGRLDDAGRELRRAADADPDKVRRWAEDDADLDPLRGRDDWPLPTSAAG
jgi:hypothetical protein